MDQSILAPSAWWDEHFSYYYGCQWPALYRHSILCAWGCTFTYVPISSQLKPVALVTFDHIMHGQPVQIFSGTKFLIYCLGTCSWSYRLWKQEAVLVVSLHWTYLFVAKSWNLLQLWSILYYCTHQKSREENSTLLWGVRHFSKMCKCDLVISTVYPRLVATLE